MSWFKRKKSVPLLDRSLKFAGGVLGFRDLMTNMLVTGITGAGKSSILRVLLKELLADGCGLYYAAAKPGNAEEAVALAEQVGRGDDVILFDASCRNSVSLFDQVNRLATDANTKSVMASMILDQIAETVNRSGQGRGDDSGGFWINGSRMMSRAGFLLMYLARAPPSVSLLLEIIRSAPKSREEVQSEAVKEGACNRLMERAFYATKGTSEAAEFRAVDGYWFSEYPNIADKTRSGFEAQLTGACDLLSRGIPARLLGEGNIDLREAVRGNAIIVSAFDYGTWGPFATAINCALKYLLQREVLARTTDDDTLPFILCMDEYQNVLSEFDFEYAPRQRSGRGPMVVAVQGFESLHALFPGENGQSKVNTLIANMGVRAYAQMTVPTMQQFLSALGQHKKVMYGGSSGPSTYSTPWDLWFPQQSSASGSYQQTYVPVLTPSEVARLRTGAKANNLNVDFILQVAGKTWDGKPFTIATVNQGEP